MYTVWFIYIWWAGKPGAGCKEDPIQFPCNQHPFLLLTHWSYVFLALTHRHFSIRSSLDDPLSYLHRPSSPIQPVPLCWCRPVLFLLATGGNTGRRHCSLQLSVWDPRLPVSSAAPARWWPTRAVLCECPGGTDLSRNPGLYWYLCLHG